MKRLLVLSGIAASLAAAHATYSAAPPTLLTYSTARAPSASGGGLCLARPNGLRRVRLTRGSDDRTPSWSPDGRYVAFARRPAGGSASRIVVADARGRIVRRFASTTFDFDPAWSPDGSRITYVAGITKSRIVVASRQGRVLATLPTGTAASASSPAWSPDSRRIAFTEQLDIDGGQQTSNRIFVINADGTGRRLLIANAAQPAWSPDGSKIAYVAYESRLSETGHIAVARADGTEPRRLTDTVEAESRPAWQPRERLIAFARGTGAASVIAVVRPDGSGERVVVRSRSYAAFDPAWRPAVVLPKAQRQACS